MPAPLPAELIDALVHGFEHGFPHLHLLVDLERTFAREDLVAALESLVRAFPVLGCRYQPAWWRDRWVPWEGDLADLVRIEEVEDLEAATQALVREPLDVLAQPPVRLTALAQGGRTRLVLSLHHMVADGGGVKAAGNVLAAALCGRTPDPRPDSQRSVLLAARALGLRDLPTLLVEAIREGTRPLWILAARRVARAEDAGPGDPAPRWRTVGLDGRGFGAACRAEGATINDGLVAAMARLAAARSASGPVCAGFTVDLRRFLPTRRGLVTNLHGVSLVMLPRVTAAAPRATLRAVSAIIGRQKERLPGLAYTLLPALLLAPLPHALLRVIGRPVLTSLERVLQRALAVTNIGPLDEALAPFGDQVRAASILGPFVHGLSVPVVTATGFGGALTLHVEATGSVAEAALDHLAEDLARALAELQEGS